VSFDLHAGNILIDVNGALYIVDWDNPILAPKERDLMYAGGGQFGEARTPQQEEVLFYEGYGPASIDPTALAYYRYERIVEDIAVFCEQIFSTNDGGEDRKQGLRYLMSNFDPNGAIEIAYRSEKTPKGGEKDHHAQITHPPHQSPARRRRTLAGGHSSPAPVDHTPQRSSLAALWPVHFRA
jgi:spectinomycin phosphotransferase